MTQDNNQAPERLERPRVQALDDILGHPFQVLDKGFVRVVDYMGSDESIVQAARVSYGKGTKQVSEDRGLIRYLMRHRHTTPFEMADIKLHVKVPMDAWRQWIRHRTASVNEYSTRYSEAIDETQQTSPIEWRTQSKDNKQGSSGYFDVKAGMEFSDEEKDFHRNARSIYEQRIAAGMAREQARKDLPLSTYTEAYWKMNLHNLLHFLSLRMDRHAQKEIRDYANIIGENIVANWVPLTWEAFQDYRLNSETLTSHEIEIIKALNDPRRTFGALEIAKEIGWLEESKNGGLKKNRERDEAETKLIELGYEVPWLTEE